MIKYKIRYWFIKMRTRIGRFIARAGLYIIYPTDRFESVQDIDGMTALKCLEPGQTFYYPTEPYTWVAHGQCPYTIQCENHQCFFKRRDCHGYSPWWSAHLSNEARKQDQQMEDKYGEIIFPEIEGHIGTNCIRICCKNAKGYKND